MFDSPDEEFFESWEDDLDDYNSQAKPPGYFNLDGEPISQEEGLALLEIPEYYYVGSRDVGTLRVVTVWNGYGYPVPSGIDCLFSTYIYRFQDALKYGTLRMRWSPTLREAQQEFDEALRLAYALECLTPPS